MPNEGDLRLRQGKRVSCCNLVNDTLDRLIIVVASRKYLELPFYQIQTGNHLGHRVLNLKSRVPVQDIKVVKARRDRPDIHLHEKEF